MDKKLYLITNSGSIDYIFDNKEERDARYEKCLESESHYQVTHYYYGTKTMTRGEYVCDQICYLRRQNFDNALAVAKIQHQTDEEMGKNYDHIMYYTCLKCPFKDYSPFMKEEPDEQKTDDKT